MAQWLVDSWQVLGLDGQNWMLVIAGALAFYLASLYVFGLRHPRAP